MTPQVPRIPPTVRLIMPCDNLAVDADGNWTIRNPRTAFQIPEWAKFPFQANRLPVYLQLVEGLGTFDVAVEILQVMDDGTRRFVGTSSVNRGATFTAEDRLIPLQLGCLLQPVRFRTAGVYECRAVAASDDRYEPLIGQTALLRVTNGRVVG